jgi:AraC-like DNA-binding protein
MNRFTDSASTVRSILSVFEGHGLDGSGILAAAGFNRESLDKPDTRLSLEQMKTVWRAGYVLSKDPWLALHAAEQVHNGSYGIVDFICGAAATVCEALLRICWYFPLINNWAVLAVETGERECALYLGSHVGELPPPMIDFIFSTILIHTRQVWKTDWAPQRVEFTYPRPENLSEYERIFRCALRFETPVSKMVIPRRFWETPLATANPALLQVLEHYAAILLALHPPPGDCETKVRGLIGSKLKDGGPCIEAIAKELGFSPRNLQRKLKSMHKSYAQILDDVRAQTAQYYLRDPDLPVGVIAGSVGFEEASSFTRAFKRWTGISPTQYRKNIREI